MEVGKTATLTVADTPKVTETLIDLFKIDMETGKSTPQGNASLEGAEFTWSYYDGYYNADNLPAKATRTWTTKPLPKKTVTELSIMYPDLLTATRYRRQLLYTRRKKCTATWYTHCHRNKSTKRLSIRGCIYAG